MFELILTGAIAICLIFIYLLVNKPGIVSRIFIRDRGRITPGKRNKIYMEQFREHKQSRLNRNIIIQALPMFGILALIFILGNQYFVFGTVLSGSMVPTFEKGDLVLMQTFDLDLGVGDIVMFPLYEIKEPVVHRIVAKNEKGNIVTKGDANPNADTTGFPEERVSGKAVMIGSKPIVLKGLGYIIRPENIGEVTVLSKLPKSFVFSQAFQQLRAVQPLIIVFGIIFYFILLQEDREDKKRRFTSNKKDKK